jgi:O-antigen/teichoic acid export membrane protein
MYARYSEVHAKCRSPNNRAELLAETGLLVHSFVDFDLHIPGSAAWFAVCGHRHVCTQGYDKAHEFMRQTNRIKRLSMGLFQGRGIRSTLGAQIFILLLGACTGVMSARLLGPQGRGELAAAILWPSTLLMLGSMGLNQSIVFHTGRRLFPASEIWTASLFLAAIQSACVILAGILVLPLVLRSYPRVVQNSALALLLAAPILLFGGCAGSLLQGRLRLALFNATRTATPLVYASALGLLILMRKPYLPYVVGAQIFGTVAGAGVAFGLLEKDGRPGLAWNSLACAGVAKYGLKTQFESINTYINQRADQLLLSLFVAPRELGLYVVAVTLSSVVAFFPQAMGIVTLANGSNLPPSEAKQTIAHSFRLSFAWLFVTCAAIFVAAPWLVMSLFGPRFAGAVLACRILLPGTLFLGLRQVLYEGARALGKPAMPSYAEGVGTLATVVGLYLLLPRFGFVGAAIASTWAYGISLLFIVLIFSRAMDMGLRRFFLLTSSPE